MTFEKKRLEIRSGAYESEPTTTTTFDVGAGRVVMKVIVSGNSAGNLKTLNRRLRGQFTKQLEKTSSVTIKSST